MAITGMLFQNGPLRASVWGLSVFDRSSKIGLERFLRCLAFWLHPLLNREPSKARLLALVLTGLLGRLVRLSILPMTATAQSPLCRADI